MSDRLAKIERDIAEYRIPWIDDIEWLIAEVKRLRKQLPVMATYSGSDPT